MKSLIIPIGIFVFSVFLVHEAQSAVPATSFKVPTITKKLCEQQAGPNREEEACQTAIQNCQGAVEPFFRTHIHHYNEVFPGSFVEKNSVTYEANPSTYQNVVLSVFVGQHKYYAIAKIESDFGPGLAPELVEWSFEYDLENHFTAITEGCGPLDSIDGTYGYAVDDSGSSLKGKLGIKAQGPIVTPGKFYPGLGPENQGEPNPPNEEENPGEEGGPEDPNSNNNGNEGNNGSLDSDGGLTGDSPSEKIFVFDDSSDPQEAGGKNLATSGCSLQTKLQTSQVWPMVFFIALMLLPFGRRRWVSRIK